MSSPFLDFSGKVVLITGGTRGIGLETGLSFGKRGAQCILTYRWGDDDEEGILKKFESVNAPRPLIIQADASKQEDTTALLLQLKQKLSKVDVFVSNVSIASSVSNFDALSLKGLKQSISYSTWPMVAYTKEIYKSFGKYPKYIIGISSTGPDNYSLGYDYVAGAKSILEVFAKYLNFHLRDHDVCINVVRSRAIKTKSLEETFGKELAEFAKQFVPDNYWLQAEELSEAIVGLCSGYCDAISGETITVDKGTTFFDNLMEVYNRTQKNKPKPA
jgi:3-oxoacyl-[acyl-carrier protein] reductase